MHVFITGGAGFIGCNLAAHHLAQGNHVTLFDNLSRARTQHNLRWLQNDVPKMGNAALQFAQGDIRDFETLRAAITVSEPELVVHLAAQVAVTTSIQNPREDFEINALGTFNVLEAARAQAKPPAVFYASTNKVYGGLEDAALIEEATRYRLRDLPNGVTEQQQLDFHSPYGCSKGAAEQYVRDYARIYGLRTVVFRQSCVYGERQFGVEDQGWVAHFVIAAAFNKPINIYGNGKQVRDLLNVQDLVNVYDCAWHRLDAASGQAFNIGGGAGNTLAIWSEFGPFLEELAERKITITRSDSRAGDQPVFISDNGKAKAVLGWEPTVEVHTGITRLWEWVTSNPDLFR